jgi:hypothetical protein
MTAPKARGLFCCQDPSDKIITTRQVAIVHGNLCLF